MNTTVKFNLESLPKGFVKPKREYTRNRRIEFCPDDLNRMFREYQSNNPYSQNDFQLKLILESIDRIKEELRECKMRMVQPYWELYHNQLTSFVELIIFFDTKPLDNNIKKDEPTNYGIIELLQVLINEVRAIKETISTLSNTTNNEYPYHR